MSVLVGEEVPQTEDVQNNETLSLSNDLGLLMSRLVLATDLMSRTADREIFHTPENVLRWRDDFRSFLPHIEQVEEHVAQFPERTKFQTTRDCQSAIRFFRQRIEEATGLLQVTDIPFREMHAAQQKVALAQKMLRVPQLLSLHHIIKLPEDQSPSTLAAPTLPEFSAATTLEELCAVSRRQLLTVYMAMGIDPQGAKQLYQRCMQEHVLAMRTLRENSYELRYAEANSCELSLHTPEVFDRIATTVSTPPA